MDIALNGFKSTGLWPCNRYVFRDEDFSASMSNDENLLWPEPTRRENMGTEETDTPSPDTSIEFYGNFFNNYSSGEYGN